MKNTKKLVIAALLAALTTVATRVIQIPSPVVGYVHLGDCMVLLSGIILGPLWGALAAGIGSMMADILSPYIIYAPATFVIKALCAAAAAFLFRRFSGSSLIKKNRYVATALAGLAGVVIVPAGYFIYEAALYGAVAAAANVYLNIIQASSGIIGAVILLPVLSKVPDVRNMLNASDLTSKKA